MPARRFAIPDLFVLCVSFALLVASVSAQDSARQESTNSVSLAAKVIQEDVSGLPPISRAYLTAGTNQFAFLIPRGFRLDAVAEGRITIEALDNSSFIQLRRLDAMNAAPGVKLSADRCRSLLSQAHPGARVREQFTRTVDGRSGPAFDFEWKNDGGAVQAGRAAFIPTDIGTLEFKLVSTPKQFRAATYKLNNLLLSFCSSKDGKLEVVRLSNKL